MPPAANPDGPALLLFHDSLGCVALWRAFPGQLAAATGCTVVAYDRLGFGQSDPHPDPVPPPTFITDEAAHAVPLLCDALALPRLIPVGHSVGGAMALATAARWPDRCAAVITMAAQSFVEDRTLAGIRAAQQSFAQPGQLERLARYHGAQAAWVLNAWLRTWLSPDFAAWNLDALLPAVQCPVLAIHGDADEYGTIEHARRIARLTTGPCETLTLAACGHFPHKEQPEATVAALARFIAALPSGSD